MTEPTVTPTPPPPHAAPAHAPAATPAAPKPEQKMAEPKPKPGTPEKPHLSTVPGTGGKVIVKPIEVGDLRANPEGVVSAEPRDTISVHHTVVASRLFLGYGGPLAIEDKQGRGLFKALGGDAIYDLDDGTSYVLPADLAEALGIVLPAADPLEKEALERHHNFGQTIAEREKADKERLAEAKKSEQARKEATQKVG